MRERGGVRGQACWFATAKTVDPGLQGSWGQGPAQCTVVIRGQRRAQKGAAALEGASVIRRPERISLAPARSTRSRRWRRLQPYAYLRDLFTKLANGHLARDIDALMPWAQSPHVRQYSPRSASFSAAVSSTAANLSCEDHPSGPQRPRQAEAAP